jgi:ketosteroid isomerase-like protein
VLVVVGFWAVSPAQAAEEDERAVKEATAKFYAALNDLFQGELEPMKAVWSHTEDVTYMGPGGGMQVGWDQVLENWETQAAQKLGGQIRSDKLRVFVGGEIAVTCGFEVGENRNTPGGPQKVSIRATNTFRKENGQWKMIGHHTDLLPYVGPPQ